MVQYFQIGTFSFKLIYPQQLCLPENIQLFSCEEKEVSYTYQINIEEILPEPEGRLLLSRPDMQVFRGETGEVRLIGATGAPMPYGLYRETATDSAEILVHREWLNALKIDTVFNSLLVLEKRLIAEEGLILHSAYMRYQGAAILFSAPSETGKTTQANLWGQYRGGETINGDRSLLQKKDDQWIARGWPVCGSSGICCNTDTPIRAIVMLSQGKENVIRRLSPVQAFTQIYGQITINRWNREANEQAIGLIEKLVTEVPVFHLSCTISEEAVLCLEHALYPDLQE